MFISSHLISISLFDLSPTSLHLLIITISVYLVHLSSLPTFSLTHLSSQVIMPKTGGRAALQKMQKDEMITRLERKIEKKEVRSQTPNTRTLLAAPYSRKQ